MGKGIGIATWRLINCAGELNGCKASVWAFEDGLQGKEEAVEMVFENLMEIQITAIIRREVSGNLCLIGQ